MRRQGWLSANRALEVPPKCYVRKGDTVVVIAGKDRGKSGKVLRVFRRDRKVTVELFRQLLAEELPKVKTYLGEAGWAGGKFEQGAKLFDRLTTGEYVEFLTLPAYELID